MHWISARNKQRILRCAFGSDVAVPKGGFDTSMIVRKRFQAVLYIFQSLPGLILLSVTVTTAHARVWRLWCVQPVLYCINPLLLPF